ncbi:Phagocyte signaling-impaired protein [Orchesella cincta]|uniref:Phagocyte signaling-impaired protein n=1 Tax=Orchesella cincta TaxID=48709 RepID=A0A1D2MA16_ORCCI|nr:Phagocyte signaling-impaired protein [Orchesella cincta]
MNGSSNLDNWDFVRSSREDGRKLRPLYELIDSGNNKRVVSEADKILKKLPDFTCAKVFKALALIRLKHEEEARDILEPIKKQVQIDEAVIQGLSYCYEELNEPTTICKILEAACKKAPSKGLLTQCFLAQIRTDKYNKQYLTALSLYKTYNDPSYFGWAMTSLLTEAERSKDSSTRSISLLLAERMLTKFIGEENEKGRTVQENILILYVETLSKQKKWEEVLKTLEEHGGYPQPSSEWAYDVFYEVFTEALQELGKKSELFEYLKSCFMKNLDEYQLIQRIINVFKVDEEGKSWIKTLLDDLRINKPSYVVAIADLQFNYAVCQEDDSKNQKPEWLQRVQEDLKMIINYGAEKPSFYSDVGNYLSSDLVSMDIKLEFLEGLNPPISSLNMNGSVEIGVLHVYNSIGKIIRDVNYELFHRLILPDTTPIMRMERAQRCLDKYFAGESSNSCLKSKSDTEKEDLRTKEADYHDQFLVIAAGTLIAKYDGSESEIQRFFNGVLKEVRASPSGANPKAKKVKKKTKTVEIEMKNLNLEEKDTKLPYSLADQDYLIMTAILIMEFGLQRCPFNHSLRILLIKAYSRLGAIKQALRVANGLDIKHVQWDSLGYLVIWRALHSGAYFDARNIFETAEGMYSEYKKEGMDHIIAAFKYERFSMIPEFLRFRDMLLNSTQHGLIKVEKRLQEYSWAGPSQVLPVAKGVFRDMQFEEGDGIFNEDNRDFSVLQCGEMEGERLEKVKKATGDVQEVVLVARNGLLVILTELVLFVNDDEEDEEAFRKMEKRIEHGIQGFKGNMEGVIRKVGSFEEENQVPSFDGFWPPTQVKYWELGCVDTLVELLRGLKKAMEINEEEEKNGSADGALVEMGKVVGDFWTKVKLRLDENVKTIGLLTMGKCLEDIHHIIETLKFSCILVHLCLKLLRKKRRTFIKPNGLTRSSTKRKKKAATDSTENFIEKKHYFETLRESFTSLRDLITEQIMKNSPCSSIFKWEDENVQKSWAGLIGNELRGQIFSKHWNKVQSNIVESYRDQLGEFVVGINTSLKFISGVENGH